MKINSLTYPIDHDLIAKGYKNLGWQNFWKEGQYPPEYGSCYMLEHETKKESHSNRGSDHTIWCDTCQYFFKLDSSD